MYTDYRDSCTFGLRTCPGCGLLPEKKNWTFPTLCIYSSVIIPQILLVILTFTFFSDLFFANIISHCSLCNTIRKLLIVNVRFKSIKSILRTFCKAIWHRATLDIDLLNL